MSLAHPFVRVFFFYIGNITDRSRYLFGTPTTTSRLTKQQHSDKHPSPHITRPYTKEKPPKRRPGDTPAMALSRQRYPRIIAATRREGLAQNYNVSGHRSYAPTMASTYSQIKTTQFQLCTLDPRQITYRYTHGNVLRDLESCTPPCAQAHEDVLTPPPNSELHGPANPSYRRPTWHDWIRRVASPRPTSTRGGELGSPDTSTNPCP
jgi:hypothetical protein